MKLNIFVVLNAQLACFQCIYQLASNTVREAENSYPHANYFSEILDEISRTACYLIVMAANTVILPQMIYFLISIQLAN